ncbi:hypothetical protein P886_3337 [Alteromonadaceae bacterium 2753L.S.0a.02]|nr:hypothetical protein P886_3337 [Alteromonadaceae bacterium 2753L.S.0a.02]
MEYGPLDMRYLYNNEIYDNPASIPPTADVVCLFSQSDETVVFATTMKGGCLEAIECFDTLSDSSDKASEIALLAENMGVLPENAEGLSILIHRDPKDFNLGYELPDDQALVVKERFIYCASESDRLTPFHECADRYIAEVLILEPEGVIVKRGFFDANKNLLIFEYPFYTLNEYQQLNESIIFLEITSRGEQWVRQMHAEGDDLESEELLRYVLPANQDNYLQPLAHHVAVDHAFALDAEGNSIALENAQEYELVRVVYCNAEGKPLNSRLFENNLLSEAEVYDVPVEHHDFVLHAMLRQLHSEFRLLAPNTSPNASHYLRIIAPLSQRSTEQLPLEPGQSKQHISVYHLRGNLISHMCIIYDAEGNPIEERTLTSPSDFTEIFRYPVGETEK